MSLPHNCHFDLLVKDNSRLAVFGLISMEEEDKKDLKQKEESELELGKNKDSQREGSMREVREKEGSKSHVEFQEPEHKVDNQDQ